MKIGTRSVLYGAHAIWLHPWIVAWAWTRLYGFPWDPRLWVIFFIHDLGYVGCPNMDGEEGERHPERAAEWLRRLGFDERWQDLVLYHSRFYCDRDGSEPSRLCYADKLAIALTPTWLYIPMVRATGELAEYMGHSRYRESPRDVNNDEIWSNDPWTWHEGLRQHMREWVQAHT